MKHIPNFITSLNLAVGFIAITYTINGDLITASWLILAAMIFDFLDGFASRILRAYSDMGKELDSLADVVSFGVAPGLIIFSLLKEIFRVRDMFNISYSIDTVLLFGISALLPVCAGLRLAKFNTDDTQTTSFKGLPTPAFALSVITVVFAGRYFDSAPIRFLTTSSIALMIFSVLLSGLMVSRIPMISLKFTNLKIRGNEGRYILIVVCTTMLLIMGFKSIPLIVPIYIVVSLFSLFFRPKPVA
jgi:CDP-diacylglycerol--serine O-phosphatidyltransferase